MSDTDSELVAVGGPLLVIDTVTNDGRLLLSKYFEAPESQLTILQPLPDFEPPQIVGVLDTFACDGNVLWGFGHAKVTSRLYLGADLLGTPEVLWDSTDASYGLCVFMKWQLVGVTSHGVLAPPQLWRGQSTYVEPLS